MELTNTRVIAAPPAVVWAALNDTEILRRSIPGCESLDRVSDTEWRTIVATRIGPVAMRFNARITLADVTPPSAYTLRFDGQGGAAGFANGEARVVLTAVANGGTELFYQVTATIGGKLVQIGSRLVDGVVAKQAEEFFTRFVGNLALTEHSVAEPVAVALPLESTARVAGHRPRPPALYVGAAAAALVLVLVAVYLLR